MSATAWVIWLCACVRYSGHIAELIGVLQDSLKRVQCFAVVGTVVHMHGAHLVRMYVLPHGGLTSSNLRVHSIITWDWVWSEDLSSSKGPVIRRPRRITPCYRFTIIHTLETNLYSYLERCKVTSSLARSLANYGFKGIGYSSRCCSKINCIRWVICLLFFAMFLGISSAIVWAKCVKFSAIFSNIMYTKTAELAQFRHRASRLPCLFLQLPCSTDAILSDIANAFRKN